VDYATISMLAGALAVTPTAQVALPTTPAPGAVRNVSMAMGAPPEPTPAYIFTLYVRDDANEVGPAASVVIVQQGP
jgi:hypothetical protein